MASRILIIDDTPTVLDFLELVFEKQGFEVHRAGSGEQGVQKAHQIRPDVLLIDVMMPGIDGFEVCRRLRAAPETANLPLLLYSAAVGEEVRQQAIESGADEFLGKTMHHAELVARVRDWLATRSGPGGSGHPDLVEVLLDLLVLLQTEVVWMLGVASGELRHLAIASRQGEQQALRFLESVGTRRFSLGPESLFGQVLRECRMRADWGISGVEQNVEGAGLAKAMREVGAMAITAAPLSGAKGELGLLVYPNPAMLALDRSGYRSAAIAIRYAATGIALWGGLEPAAVGRIGALRLSA